MAEIEMELQSGTSSLEDAVSGRGQQTVFNEDDMLYYIPERRQSLDLGQSAMDTSNWPYMDQALSPALSYVSLATGERSVEMDDEDGSDTRVHLERTDSFSSCYSLDSDDCEKRIPRVKSKGDTVSELSDTPELITTPNEIKHPSLTVAFTFKAISNTLGKLSEGDVKRFKTMLWKRYSQSFNTPPQGMDMVDLVDRLLECYDLEVSLQITKTLLGEMGKNKIVDYLQTLCIRNEVCYELRETLKRTYGEVCDDTAMQQEKRPFDDIFTNLHITSTCGNGPNIEHEVMRIEKLDSNRDAGELLSTKDIFSAEKLECSNVRLILITGVAGSGKSMAIRRLILDWVEERSHQHISFLFPLPFRELKQFEGSTVSLLEIIQKFYPETKKLKDEHYRSEDCKIMFVFDGLDEYGGKLDFENTELLGDHTDSTTLNVIVVNLLRGRLLYRGLFLVTSRPQVKRCIPWDTYYEEIEIRGFCDPNKDEYFKRRFTDPAKADQVIAYIRSFKTLSIMCHLPLFCSLVADECHQIFREHGTQAELPRSITYLYTKLVLALARQHRTFRDPDHSPDNERDFLMKLGKLALNMLEQGQFKITRSDWKGTGISSEEAVMNTGLCTQYVTKPFVLFHEYVLSFIHPTMQEYLAALYVFLSFVNQGKNIFEQPLKDKFKGMFKGYKAMELYKSAVNKSLLCDDGKLDIFLRFLFGMALKPSLELLQPFCTSSVKWSTEVEDAAALIRKKIRENQHPGRNENLQRCLEELGVLATEAASS
ncbi:protein NLRC3 [Toxotes jaculatrix]|uniref:protein NLRC3 n=1 Tax=Toxotes jaculatrix TaxID=941984 RepID=UPI001B3AEE43|nr:protein NLRC3 [Toxotes jaculatrix]XP_040907321.1 protein NLRC3 [Toxotes jaculatrix]XP_040907322.1 protein NLRC3 [Toxotes jaculatrix]